MKRKFYLFRLRSVVALTVFLALALTALVLPHGTVRTASSQGNSLGRTVKGQPIEDLLSSGGNAGRSGPVLDEYEGPGNNNPQPGFHDNGRGGNTFVNDPCIDPPPPSTRRTVQAETEIATFGKYMVAGYNDSFGFYDNTQGLSGFAYSIDGGNKWIDGGGLPPVIPSPTLFNVPGPDRYFGDPVVVVDKSPRTFTTDSNGNPLPQPITQPAGTFYFASLYSQPGNPFPGSVGTLSVNRGRFLIAPPSTPETASNTRCQNHPEEQGIPDTSNLPKERVKWDPPSVAVPLTGPTQFDFLDKEWLYVDQATGVLYLVYVRFSGNGSGDTPVELVRSFDGGRTWTPPSVVIPNSPIAFYTGSFVLTVPKAGGTRVLVFVWAREFDPITGAIVDRRIEYAISEDNGNTFGPLITIAHVPRQSTAPGWNRPRTEILNAPFAASRANDVYVTYYSGKPPGNPPQTGATSGPRPSDIFLNASHDGGLTFGPQVKVNDDVGDNSHLFPSVQVSKQGWVYVGWLDRRNDIPANELTDAWAAVSRDGGLTFGHSKLQTDVATSWRTRADAQPNFGDYNSSELINDNQFVMIWADGRFPGGTFIPATCTPAPPPGQTCPPRLSSTPDTIFTITTGLGVGNDPNPNNP